MVVRFGFDYEKRRFDLKSQGDERYFLSDKGV